LVTFQDVPGYLPGVKQEHGGIIRHGAKVIYAYSEATVPKITVLIRKSYGGAYVAMCSKHLGADVVFALPTAEIAVMGPEGAVEILFRRRLREEKKVKEKLVINYRAKFANPYVAASRGYIDDIIEPQEMRPRLISALEMLLSKRKSKFRLQRKHGNIPL
jgi:acetyl-CoA carboxylase carboxyltransferase component